MSISLEHPSQKHFTVLMQRLQNTCRSTRGQHLMMVTRARLLSVHGLEIGLDLLGTKHRRGTSLGGLDFISYRSFVV